MSNYRKGAVTAVFLLAVALLVVVLGVEHAATVLIYVALLPVNVFPVLYAARSPWWRTAIGRSLMVLVVGLALLLDVSGLYWLLGPEYTGRHWIRLVTYVVIAGGAYGLLAALVGAQRREPDADPVPPTAERRI